MAWPDDLALTRELIAAAFPDAVVDDEQAMALLPDADVAARYDDWMSSHPGGDLWLFGYGSLMWKPELDFIEQRLATVRGWHRRFCLWQWRFRGSRAKPGLMLALDRGGACAGLAFRIAGPDLRAKLAETWRREIGGDGYRPRWVTAATEHGPVTALAFVINRDSSRYAGRLSDETVAAHIASACGETGPNAEYLLETVMRCRQLGIHDRLLWRMQELVAKRLGG
jgi:cation transport protein ChaC